ncbi:MAG TPA: hypothetical protein VI522_03510, partial [Gammaproteobacteria bacterium]|nr:hypothetical protein [Gammaproteobacteria bacterium]
MKLTQQGLALLTQLMQQLEGLKGAAGDQKFVLPTINLFFTSILEATKDQLRFKLITSGLANDSYKNVAQAYQRSQAEYVEACLTGVVTCLQKIISAEHSIKSELDQFIDFVEYDQLSAVTGLKPVYLDSLNAAIKWRLTYYLLNKVYDLLENLAKNKYLVMDGDQDNAFLSRLSQLIAKTDQSTERKQQLATLFYNELHIREASLIATGELPRVDQLSDIFIVYKTASFGWSQHTQDHAASYYNLAVKTLLQLASASKIIGAHSATGQLSFHINTISQETRIGTQGLVRSSAFGINIAHEDTELFPLIANDAQDYRLEKTDCLKASLKIALLQHIEHLSLQLVRDPKHYHTQRRIEKKSALEAILRANEQGDLSPATFADIIMCKPYLYVAFGLSKTQDLIDQARKDLKMNMWLKLAQDHHSIGKYGYAINDPQFIETLYRKYQSLAPGISYDTRLALTQLLVPGAE